MELPDWNINNLGLFETHKGRIDGKYQENLQTKAEGETR